MKRGLDLQSHGTHISYNYRTGRRFDCLILEWFYPVAP